MAAVETAAAEPTELTGQASNTGLADTAPAANSTRPTTTPATAAKAGEKTAAAAAAAAAGTAEHVQAVVERPEVGPVSLEIIQQAKAGLHGDLFDLRYCDQPSKGGSKRRRRARHESFEPDILSEYTVEDLFEYDFAGWAPIHYATFRGFQESVRVMLTEIPLLTDLPTADKINSTPLLLATMANNLNMVKMLIELGADVTYFDRLDHGIVELCAFRHYVKILDYLLQLNHPELPVWKRLVDMLRRTSDHDTLASSETITLTLRRHCRKKQTVSDYWLDLFNSEFVQVMTVMLASGVAYNSKSAGLAALLQILPRLEVKAKAVECEILPVLISLLTVDDVPVVERSSNAIQSICEVDEYRAMAVESGALTALTASMKNNTNNGCLVAIVNAIDALVINNNEFQDALRNTPDAITTLIGLYKLCKTKSLFIALTNTVGDAVRGNKESQSAFVKAGAGEAISTLLKTIKVKAVMLSALEAIQCLSEGNEETQQELLSENCFEPIIAMLKRTRYVSIQERTAGSLWAIAGNNIEERLLMAERITIRILIEFVQSPSPLLNYIGADGLFILASGPLGHHNNIAIGGGVPALIQLIRKTPPETDPVIVGRPLDAACIRVAAIRALRASCIQAGYVNFPQNQDGVCEPIYNGLETLVQLLVDEDLSQIVRAEAAYALGAVALSNKKTARMVFRYPCFDFAYILDLFHDSDTNVQIVTGLALTAFAYNSASNQRKIARLAGNKLTFGHYVDILKVADEPQKANAAFQVVVLCRTFPDQKPAEAACKGIKLLTTLIQNTKQNPTRVLVANYVAALSHTRPGLPDAFISIDTVHSLAQLLTNPAEMVRGHSAIALGYLSYNPIAKRQILNYCRVDPYLYNVIKFYTHSNKLSIEFLEDWKHYIQIGLPPIDPTRKLVRKQPPQLFDEVRPMTLSGDDDKGLEPDPEEPEGDEIEVPTSDDQTNMSTRDRNFFARHHQTGDESDAEEDCVCGLNDDWKADILNTDGLY